MKMGILYYRFMYEIKICIYKYILLNKKKDEGNSTNILYERLKSE